MPTFVYNGPSTSLSIAGRTLDRGQPTILEGRAAEAAASHPNVSALDALAGGKARAARPTADRPAAFAEFAALKARAKDLGLPATGKKADLEAAVAAAEARLAAG